VLSAACMLWRLRRNGFSVNPLQQAVLLTLRRLGPLSLDELTRNTGASWTRAVPGRCRRDPEGTWRRAAQEWKSRPVGTRGPRRLVVH
jgi:hypothetical protein